MPASGLCLPGRTSYMMHRIIRFQTGLGPTNSNWPGRIMALDYGRRRIGVAASDPMRIVSKPRCVVGAGPTPKDPTDELLALVQDLEPSIILVGIPLNMDGSEGEMALEAREFGQRLGERSGVPIVERDERLRHTAELLGLSALLDRRPSQLSGGQQQRVALGRAIIAEKHVCLMDEPLSNLDAKLRHEMRIEIRALQRKLGISMIYVTHDQAEAMSMADRVILLRDGRVEQDAPPEEIYQRPATVFAAGFIGTPPMNILRLAEGPGGLVAEGSDGPAILNRSITDLSLGVRPEDMTIADSEGLPAVVRGVEYLGADSIVDCQVGDQIMAVRSQGRIQVESGTRVGLTWPPESEHYFHTSSGQRRDDLGAERPVEALSMP